MQTKLNIIERSAACILVADKDFGRCTVASDLPRALWPAGEKNVLQRLVDHIASEGINKIVICSALSPVLLGKSLDIPQATEVRFHQELFPRGTAGSISDAWHIADPELLFVFHAEMISPPDINTMLKQHRDSQADMTIVFNPSEDNQPQSSEAAQIYICQRSVIDMIPNQGYCDIKETLLPVLIKSSKTIYAAKAQSSVGNFRNWQQYINALADKISQNDQNSISQTAIIGDDVRMIPPVVVCDNARIGSNTLIIGPAVIGPDVRIDQNAVITESVIWQRSTIAKNAFIQGSLLNQNSHVAPYSTVKQELYSKSQTPANSLVNLLICAAEVVKEKTQTPLNIMKNAYAATTSMVSEIVKPNTLYIRWITGLLILAAFIWSYYTSVFTDLWTIWMQSDEYSSGLLVPLITAYIIWTRRKDLAKCKISPSLWGLVVFAFAQAFRFFGLFFMYSSAERISMLMTVTSLIILLFGWKITCKLSTVLLFLTLMIPLPNSVHNHLTIPLQNWATASAVYSLETIGFTVIREGNVITLDGATVAVAEACNGLRMIASFFVINSMVALLVKRGLVQKFIIVASSLPVALFCNTLRLTATSVAFTYVDSARWETVFHDFGGLAMMPVAIAIILFELWVLSKIVASNETVPEQIITRK